MIHVVVLYQQEKQTVIIINMIYVFILYNLQKSSIFCVVHKNEQKYDINFKPVLQCKVLYLIENVHLIMLLCCISVFHLLC